MSPRRITPGLVSFVCAATFGGILVADDWTNAGGNAGRNGQTAERGPDAAELLWSGGRTSIIAWQPVTAGRRAFMVRQSGFPGSEPNASPVIAMDLDSGQELWRTDIPFNTGDWTTWVAGVSNGLVYAGRSGNGASVSAKLYALDQTDGSVVWTSEDEIDAGAYDGVVFAPNGDPIVGSFRDIWRISFADGTTVWNATRTGSVSGTCGAALYGDAVYVADASGTGTVIKRYDLATGAFEYQSPGLGGFTIQNTPMVGPDGTVYLSRTQNNPATDYFYALTDDGTQIAIKWFVEAGWTTTSEFGVGPDGSVYMMARGNEFVRLDPADGAVVDTAGVIPADSSGPRVAVDADGKVYLSNGAFSNGRLYSFNADLTERWSLSVPNINIGAPAIGEGGTLVVCGIGTNVRAYRTMHFPPGDLNCDGAFDGADIDPFFLALGDPAQYAQQFPDCDPLLGDMNADGSLDGADIDPFFDCLGGGNCP